MQENGGFSGLKKRTRDPEVRPLLDLTYPNRHKKCALVVLSHYLGAVRTNQAEVDSKYFHGISYGYLGWIGHLGNSIDAEC